MGNEVVLMGDEAVSGIQIGMLGFLVGASWGLNNGAIELGGLPSGMVGMPC